MENKNTPLIFPKPNPQSDFKDINVGHVAIRTVDYDALIQWYIEKLDFRLVKEFTAGSMQLAFIAPPNTNDMMIEILGISKTEQDNNQFELGYDHICFNVENLDLTIEKLQKRGIEIVRKFDMPVIGKRVAFIADLLGNKIEFCEDVR